MGLDPFADRIPALFGDARVDPSAVLRFGLELIDIAEYQAGEAASSADLAAAETDPAEARAHARSKQRKIEPGTLVAAEWVIMVTSLAPEAFATDEVLELYRLRWRIEIAFKRMKSLIGLAGPPGACPVVARVWVLCHLIAVLLTEAQLAAIGDSPRRDTALDRACGAPVAC